VTDAAGLDEIADAGELLDENIADDSLEPEQALKPEDLEGIVLYTLDWSVQSLIERVGNTFDVNPSFQRRDAWTPRKKSLYIESLALGLPIPQVVLAEDPKQKGRFIVLDGKQRLVTIKQFCAPDQRYPSFKLRGLQFLSHLDGMSFADMQSSLTSNEYAESILTQPIRTIVVRNWQQPAVLYEVFIRLNQNSLPLSPQELRQALFPSAFTRWINARSAESDSLHQARRAKREDFRMRDAEMLLRFIAWVESIEHYRGNLRQFLDDACVKGQEIWNVEGESYFERRAQQCETAIARTFRIFGDDAFLRYEKGSYNRRFNIAVFDLMTVVLGDESVSDDSVHEFGHELRAVFERLCDSDESFRDSITATTKSIAAVSERFLTFITAVERTIGVQLAIRDRVASLAS
jgi:Protein of unknown function DUF262